jgi:hypothetical protein
MPPLLYSALKRHWLWDDLTPTTSFFGVRILSVPFPLRRFGTGLGVVSDIFGSVFGFSPGILDFAFGLFCGAFDLGFGIVRPFARLALNASGYILNFSFNTVLIHFIVSCCAG